MNNRNLQETIIATISSPLTLKSDRLPIIPNPWSVLHSEETPIGKLELSKMPKTDAFAIDKQQTSKRDISGFS